MQAMFSLSNRSMDQLESDLINRSKNMNTQEYKFLVDLREFDLRQGWKAYHFNNCADWLSMKCGIDVTTGREKARVARALFDLPQLSAAFESGDLSYSKVRSLSRVVTSHNETEFLDFALQANAQQVQQRCCRVRNGDRAVSTGDANRLHDGRYLSRSINESGRMTISIELPVETGELVMQAIEQAVCEEEENFHARQADALVEVAKAYLAEGSEKKASSADHYQIMVHVDEKALRPTDTSRDASECKSDLPIETVRRLCCDGAIVPVTEDEEGNPLKVGRKHRIVQPALRRALHARDKCCSYPGCTHDKWLDGHHIEHWADGGETSLDNTLLLCSKQGLPLFSGTTACFTRVASLSKRTIKASAILRHPRGK
jgi:hypothetical protein